GSMSPEHAQAELPAEGDLGRRFGGEVVEAVDSGNRDSQIIAFKFGGTSLLGGKRMLHAASLVQPLALKSQVVVVVSAMKGVTDRLLLIAQSLAERKSFRARSEAEAGVHLDDDVLRELPLDSADRDRVAYELDSLGRDLLHEVPAKARVGVSPELFDRLASFGERFSARLFAAALECSGVPAVP